MDRLHKFGRYSKRVFKRLTNREEENVKDLDFTTHIHEEKKTITWHIDNFDRCPLKIGEYHESPYFFTGFSSTTNWCIRLYPKGKTIAGKVGLFITKISSNTSTSVEYNSVILSDVGIMVASLEKKKICMDSEEYGSDVSLSCSNFLHNKSIRIICHLIIGYVDDDVGSCTAGPSTLCSLSTDLREMYASGKFCDFTLQVGKKSFHVHKVILAARSNVFAAMFGHDMEENHTNNAVIDDVEPSVMSDVLQYIYTGAVDLNVDNAIALFSVADKYSLAELQKRCVRVMLAKLSVENVCRIAILADMHSESKLKTAANYIFRKYKHQIFVKKEWNAMIRENPQLASDILQTVSSDFNTKCSDACSPNS